MVARTGEQTRADGAKLILIEVVRWWTLAKRRAGRLKSRLGAVKTITRGEDALVLAPASLLGASEVCCSRQLVPAARLYTARELETLRRDHWSRLARAVWAPGCQMEPVARSDQLSPVRRWRAWRAEMSPLRQRRSDASARPAEVIQPAP